MDLEKKNLVAYGKDGRNPIWIPVRFTARSIYVAGETENRSEPTEVVKKKMETNSVLAR